MHGAAPEVVAAGGAAAGVRALLREAPAEGVERSFKFVPGNLLADRFLAGWALARTGAGWALDACRRLAMPAQGLDAFRAVLGAAEVVHFGYEAAAGRTLVKAYLEFPGRLAQAGTTPFELHLAWKWDPQSPSHCELARYRCLPGLALEAIQARMGRLDGSPAGMLLRDVASLAASRSSEPLMYLEVGEEGNPRASFDLNVHAAGLRLRDVEPQLRGLRAHFGVPAAPFEACLAAARNDALGHLSGGTGRNGAPFATIYHAERAA